MSNKQIEAISLEQAAKQALEYLQDNQHYIADNERHAYVMEYNAFIERLEKIIAEAEQPRAQSPDGEGTLSRERLEWVKNVKGGAAT